MKKTVVVLALSLLLVGCGNSAQKAAPVDATTQSTEAASEENTLQETAEDLTAEETTVEETVAEETTAEESTEAVIEPETEELKEVTEKITAFETSKTMYTTVALNVRRGPSTDYEVVSHLALAQAVEVTGQAETGWYQMMLDGEPAYVSDKYLSETKVEIPAPTPAPSQPAEAGTQTVTVAPAGVIMVGDSRCVQMQAAVGGGGCTWVCENSKEYTWFAETAIPQFDAMVGKGTKVVINMGVNDPDHLYQYIELVNAKAAEWAQRGARTYFVSVNPVWENPYTEQEDVDTFNATVPGSLVGVTWIDTSSWLQTNGYRLVDGLHYDDPTYVNIFNLIMGGL